MKGHGFEGVEIKSDQHHKSDAGLPLCGVPIQGIMTLYEDDKHVTCKKCLEKIRNPEEKSDES